ncbi:MAG TPA: hypothetical protein DC005_03420 [Proteobacteria bacterium]|nr:hypothetical protein [Pseudomonadota bacterium]
MSFARIVAALGGLLAVLFGYITVFNRGDTTVVLWIGRSVTLPMSVLLLLAIFAGACFVLLMVGAMELSGVAHNLGRRRRRRQQQRFELLFEKGCDLADLGLEDRALSCFERILDHDSGHVSALVQLGAMRRRQGDVEAALRLHKRALERDPTHVRALVSLVEDCLAAQRWQEALEVCQKILDVEGEALRVLVWARDLQVRLGRLEEAIDAQRHLLRHAGIGSEAHRMLRRLQFLQAMARLGTEDKERARKELAEILHQDRTFVPAQVELGRLLLAEEKEKEAVRRWREGYGQTHDIVFLHLLERYYLGREDPDAAIAVYLNALKDEPASVELQFCLGKLYLRLEMLDELLTRRTRLVAVVHGSNALGTINPVREIATRAHAAGALLLVDGAQAVAHLEVDVHAMGADFYAFSGHKVYGPMGIGCLYGRRELLEQMAPYQGGGEMIRHVTFEETTYAPPPARFEAGTPNVAGAVGLAAALDYLDSLGRERIAAHEQDLLAYGLAQLAGLIGVRLIGNAPERLGILSMVIAGAHPHDVATILDRDGIAIRAGHHCAHPVMDHFHLPATARASLALYNRRAEIDRLVAGIHHVQEVLGR